MHDLSVKEMLKAGVHFGHQTSRWHPKMRPYIFGERNGIHIIDLERTQVAFSAALDYIQKLAAEKKIILFVGTKRQAKELVRQAADKINMPHLTERWLGGFLTNFEVVSKLPQRLVKLKKDMAEGRLEKYTKKERLDFQKEIERLEFLVGGVQNLTRLPDAIFILDVKEEKTAFREAQRRGIPIIAVCDTNTNPDGVAYPIPANDDATKSIAYILDNIVAAFQVASKES